MNHNYTIKHFFLRCLLLLAVCCIPFAMSAQESGDKDKAKKEKKVKDKAKDEATDAIEAVEEKTREKGKKSKDKAEEEASDEVEEVKDKARKSKDKGSDAADNAEASAKEKAEKPPKVKKEKPFKPKRGIKNAKKALKTGSHFVVTENLEKVMEVKPQKHKWMWQLANSFKLIRHYTKAEEWYKKVMDGENAETYPTAAYEYAIMMKMNGKYEECIPVLEEFKKKYRGPDSYIYKKYIINDVEGAKLGISSRDTKVPVEITHLEKPVNGAYSDISPMMIDEETLVYSSFATEEMPEYDPKKGSFDSWMTLYASKMTGDAESFSMPEIYDNFNGGEEVHNANPSLSPDGKRVYFTRCEQSGASAIRCDIYVSSLDNGAWTEPEIVEGINDEEATTTHPTLAVDDRGNEILYFATNRERGKGGMDIWYSTINKKGRYSRPRNAGSKINTPRDEATPFFNPHDGILYFASNGHVSLGGYDIMKGYGSKSRFTKFENMGPPVNSSADDMYPYFYHKDEKGFFVSNRPGIITVKHETCCDDIFHFAFDFSIKVAVKGLVYDVDDTAKIPMDDVDVTLMFNTMDRTQDAGIAEVTTENMEPFFFNLNPENNYRIVGIKPGYLTGSVELSTLGMAESDTFEVEIFLEKYDFEKAYTLNDIYYDFDKWDLKQESTLSLDTLYDLMIENPQLMVELSSHTDMRGNDEYNQELSQKRAESCVKYLIGKGIDQSRITPVGYGETMLLDDCLQYEECGESSDGDCPCHQLNRRTVFKFTGEMDDPDAELNYDEEETEEVFEDE